MSLPQKTELFLSNGAKQKLSHLEEMIGCERNTLNSVHSPVHYTEALDCYFRLTRLFNQVDSKYFATRISASLAFMGAASGIVLNTNVFGLSFDQSQIGALNGFAVIMIGVGGYLAPKLKREEDHYQDRLDEEISSFRARLSEPAIK